MIIQKLKLRGAIGIKKGIGLDEISLDLTTFGAGLIALTGRNGSGKTTIMENLHPYRRMVSRDGSLAGHFFLKDSYRELLFTHEGHDYRSVILIDALTGASEAYIYKDGTALNEGKLTTYDNRITEILGSEELFFNSVFSGQKSKGIAELSVAERRKLFYELLSLTKYEGYCEQMKLKLREAEDKLKKAEGEISVMKNLLTSDSVEDYKEKINDAAKEVQLLQALIKNLTEQLAIYAERKEETAAEIVREEEKLKQLPVLKGECEGIELELYRNIKQSESEIEAVRNAIELLAVDTTAEKAGIKIRMLANQADIERKKKLTENKVLIAGKLARIDEVNLQVDELGRVNMDLMGREHEAIKIFHTQMEVYTEHFNEYQSAVSEYKGKKAKVDQLNSKIERTEKDVEIIDGVPCDEGTGMGCQFLKNAFGAKFKMGGIVQERDALLAGLTEPLNEDEVFKELKEKYTTERDKTLYGINREKEDVKVKIRVLQNELTELKQHDWKALESEARDAESEIKSLSERLISDQEAIERITKSFESQKKNLEDQEGKLILSWKAKIQDLKKRRDDLANKISALNDQDLMKLRIELSNTLAFYKGIETEKAEAEGKQNQATLYMQTQQKELEDYLNMQARIAEAQTGLTVVQDEIREYTFLVKAFDKTGIPVLKLENSGIEITTVANDLLQLFENKFRIVFETTSLTKDKKKQKETFDINIVEEDGVTEIGNKSGGQQVWLETAIQLAIALVVRQQGRNLQTSFLDEKDGALDIENAYSYIRMIEQAHRMSGVHNSFIITHRAELLEYIPQQVKLTDGGLELCNG